jgi:hypothetical protein
MLSQSTENCLLKFLNLKFFNKKGMLYNTPPSHPPEKLHIGFHGDATKNTVHCEVLLSRGLGKVMDSKIKSIS